MAKSKIDADKLKLPPKSQVIKGLSNAEQIELAVEKIHGQPSAAPISTTRANGQVPKGKVKRYSVNVPIEMHLDWKMFCMKKDIDMNDHFLRLLERDIYPERFASENKQPDTNQ